MITNSAAKAVKSAWRSVGRASAGRHVLANSGRKVKAASAVDKLITAMSPAKLAKEIDRILHPDTALEVALAANRRGMRDTTKVALEKSMSLAYTLQGRDTVAKASQVLGFPKVGERHVKGLDKLLVGRAAEEQAKEYAKRLATVNKPAEMLKLWRQTPGALEPRTTLAQDVKDAARQAFTGEFALIGPLHFPSWAGESIYKHLGVFNRLP
jgi:hypothetical protein